MRDPTTRAQASVPGVVRAMTLVAVRGPVPWLLALAVVGTAACLRWWSVPTVGQAYALALLPAGATVLGVLLWTRAAQGWRAVVTRPCGAARPALAVLGLAVAGTTAVTTLVLLVLALAGQPWGATTAAWSATVVTGTTVACTSVALTARLGPSVALSVGAVGFVLGLLVGSNPPMSRLFWWAVPWGWGVVVEPDRLVVVVAACVLLCTAGLVVTLAGARRADGALTP